MDQVNGLSDAGERVLRLAEEELKALGPDMSWMGPAGVLYSAIISWLEPYVESGVIDGDDQRVKMLSAMLISLTADLNKVPADLG